MNRYLKPSRLWMVIKRDELLNWRGILTGAFTIGGISIVIFLLHEIDSNGRGLHSWLFPLILFLGGFLTASGAFSAMHGSSSVHDWLMLPASREEKFLSCLMVSSLGYWIFAALIYFFSSVLGLLLSLLINGNSSGGLFNPLSGEVFKMLPHYLVLQSIFFAGGAVFRKHQFLKTLMTLAAGFIVYAVFTALVARVFVGDYRSAVHSIDFSFGFDAPLFISTRRLGGFLLTLVRTVYYGILAPFFWLVAYFRVREAEVRNAV